MYKPRNKRLHLFLRTHEKYMQANKQFKIQERVCYLSTFYYKTMCNSH